MARFRRVRRVRRSTRPRRSRRVRRSAPRRRRLHSVLGKRRNTGPSSRGVSKRPRTTTVADKGGYNQWSTYKGQRTYGRLSLAKLIKINTYNQIFAWKATQVLDAGGNLQMDHFIGAPGVVAMPCYCVELTSCINITDSAGTVTTPSPVWKMTRANAGVKFTPVQGQDNTGTAATQMWQEFSGGGGAVTRYPHAKSILKWCELRFDLFGMKNNPTKYVLELCQFDEDVLPVGDDTYKTDPAYVQFWDAEMKPFVYNPNIKTASFGRRPMKKVLDRRVFMIDPTSSTESDTDPHTKTLRLFYRMNRQCRFDWKYSTGTFQTFADFESSKVVTTIAENQTSVHPNARVFFMLRATKFTLDANQGAQTTALTPTFNMQVRMCHATGA